MEKETTLITGGSSGIGFELAKVLAQNNYNIILVSRKQEELDAAANNLREEYKIPVSTLAKDLSNPSQIQEVYDFCRQQNLQVDVLVNNAGFGTYGAFVEQDVQRQLNMLDVNIRALTHLTALFLPEMVKRGSGKILNIASTAAFQPGPFFATYYASKAYVLSFSRALRSEVLENGIYVTCLCPGPTRTNFFNKEPAIKKTRLIRQSRLMEPSQVALVGFNALMKNKAVVIPGFKNKLLAFGAKIFPANLVTEISKRTLKKANPVEKV